MSSEDCSYLCRCRHQVPLDLPDIEMHCDSHGIIICMPYACLNYMHRVLLDGVLCMSHTIIYTREQNVRCACAVTIVASNSRGEKTLTHGTHSVQYLTSDTSPFQKRTRSRQKSIIQYCAKKIITLLQYVLSECPYFNRILVRDHADKVYPVHHVNPSKNPSSYMLYRLSGAHQSVILHVHSYTPGQYIVIYKAHHNIGGRALNFATQAKAIFQALFYGSSTSYSFHQSRPLYK